MANLDGLKRLTKELAEEIEYHEEGPSFKFIKLILDSVKSPVVIISNDFKTIYLNPLAIAMGEKYGIDTSLYVHCYEAVMGINSPCKGCPAKRALKSKQIENTEWISPVSGIKYMVTDIPLIYDGVSGVIEILNPINRVKNNDK